MLLFYCSMRKIMRYCPIQRNCRENEYLCRFSKEYLTALKYMFHTLFLDRISKILTYDTHFYHKLSQSHQLKKQSCFLAHSVIVWLLVVCEVLVKSCGWTTPSGSMIGMTLDHKLPSRMMRSLQRTGLTFAPLKTAVHCRPVAPAERLGRCIPLFSWTTVILSFYSANWCPPLIDLWVIFRNI